MKKIFLSLVAVVSAVTLMAQELPTACDAQIEFKYCFTTYSTLTREYMASDLPYTWNGVTFTALNDTKVGTIENARGCDSVVTMTLIEKVPPVGAAGGTNARTFSVSDTKEVFFSQGNLQYCKSPVDNPTATHKVAEGDPQQGIFQFAEEQYNYVGLNQGTSVCTGNVYYTNASGVKTKCTNKTSSYGTAPYIVDLFVWGNSGYRYDPDSWSYDNKFGQEISATNDDWGWFNAISNGGNEPKMWRMLSADEWLYLMNSREQATNKRGCATITLADNSVTYGFIILPDNWTQEASTGITFNANLKSTTANQYTEVQWKLLEQDGAVFVPSAGEWITNGSVSGITAWDGMMYWTGSCQLPQYSGGEVYPKMYKVKSGSSSYSAIGTSNYTYLHPVRLVQDKYPY